MSAAPSVEHPALSSGAPSAAGAPRAALRGGSSTLAEQLLEDADDDASFAQALLAPPSNASASSVSVAAPGSSMALHDSIDGGDDEEPSAFFASNGPEPTPRTILADAVAASLASDLTREATAGR